MRYVLDYTMIYIDIRLYSKCILMVSKIFACIEIHSHAFKTHSHALYTCMIAKSNRTLSEQICIRSKSIRPKKKYMYVCGYPTENYRP